MLKSVVFVPSAPVLVPELAGPGADDVVRVREASLDALRTVASSRDGVPLRWVVVGDGVGAQANSQFDGRGTFVGFGVDTVVSLGPADPSAAPDPGWPTSMLLAGWYRRAAGLPSLEPVVVDAESDVEQIADVGASLRARLEQTPEPTALMVVADGATSLSARAPGGGDDPRAHVLQERIDAALGAADATALTALSPAECTRWGVDGRVAWQVAAAAVGTDDVTGHLNYAGAPLGVGYTVATWSLAP